MKNHVRLLNPDEEIYLYKQGSRGEVVGIYRSAKEIEDAEKRFHGKFSVSSVLRCLSGSQKRFFSFNHQCKVRPVIKKIVEKKDRIVA